MVVPLNRVASLLAGDTRVSLPRTLLALAHRKRVLVGRSFRVRGIKNVHVAAGGGLLLGTEMFGFEDDRTGGLLRIRGRLDVDGRVMMALGTRLDIGPDAVMRVGARTSFSPRVRAVISSGLTIGKDCAVSWDVQFLDDDLHAYKPDGKVPVSRTRPITIGDRVWVGSRSSILKGVTIADGCIVAANSTVTRSFTEPRTLIGGSPARVLRSGVDWD